MRDQTNRPGEAEIDLFSPSLQGYVGSAAQAAQRPWRPWSTFWVAFFGGVVPYTVVAYINGGRLHLDQARRRQIVLIGVVGFVATIAAHYLLFGGIVPAGSEGTFVRLSSRIVAVLAFAVIYQIQKSADRRYRFNTDSQYASLWGFGLLVTISLGLAQNILVYLIVAALR